MSNHELVRDLKALLRNMEFMGESDMGNLTYAEAALFHNATRLVDDLLASIHNRGAEE